MSYDDLPSEEFYAVFVVSMKGKVTIRPDEKAAYEAVVSLEPSLPVLLPIEGEVASSTQMRHLIIDRWVTLMQDKLSEVLANSGLAGSIELRATQPEGKA